MQVAPDPVVDALWLPFDEGVLSLPAADQVLLMRARAGRRAQISADWTCVQGFKPDADALAAHGARVVAEPPERLFKTILLLPPRQRDEARALFAASMSRLDPDGTLVASVANSEGARSAEADLTSLAGPVQILSKHKCRVFWCAGTARFDTTLAEEWLRADAPRAIDDDGFLSRPGIFSWSRIDPASALLAEVIPSNLYGRGADLGAGSGFLSRALLGRNPGITSLHLYEAEHRALDLARRNVASRAGLELDFRWRDVARGLPDTYDFMVSNPPFHERRADRPELGQAFIKAAAAALRPGGRFWLVANRHLPYEDTLARCFAGFSTLVTQDGFKVMEAHKASA